jgi:hypothetical protein
LEPDAIKLCVGEKATEYTAACEAEHSSKQLQDKPESLQGGLCIPAGMLKALLLQLLHLLLRAAG